MTAVWERALNVFFLSERIYTLLFLWILFLETGNKVSVDTKTSVLILYAVTEQKLRKAREHTFYWLTLRIDLQLL